MPKKQKKEEKQKKWGLKVNSQIPIVLVSVLDDHIQSILNKIIEGISAIGIQLVFLEPTSSDHRKSCEVWTSKFPNTITVLKPSEVTPDIVDMELLEEVTVAKLKDLKKNHVVPVALRGLVEVFDPITETGNGFLFEEGNAWSLFATLVRAAETYRFPYDWRTLMRSS